MGLRVRDIGDELTWPEFRSFIQNLKPGGDSALYRAQYPKSWWWTPEMDMSAAILHRLEAANWQRGGGKGGKPKMMTRPKEGPKTKKSPTSGADLAGKRKALKDEIERRRLGRP